MSSEGYGPLQLFATHGRISEIPRGWGGLFKVKILEATYEAKLELPGGTGGANKKPSMGGVWIFSGTAQCTLVGQITV